MPTAWMPARLSALPAFGSAKKPSLLTECPLGGAYRQHSRLLNTMSVARNSSATLASGSAGELTPLRTPPKPHMLAPLIGRARKRENETQCLPDVGARHGGGRNRD